MPIVAPIQRAIKVQKADGSNAEIPEFPETYELATGDLTVPVATNHLRALNITFEPTLTGSPTGAEKANIYARADNSAEWFLLDNGEVDLSAGDPVNQQITCPCGQLRVENEDLETLIVRIEGLSAMT